MMSLRTKNHLHVSPPLIQVYPNESQYGIYHKRARGNHSILATSNHLDLLDRKVDLQRKKVWSHSGTQCRTCGMRGIKKTNTLHGKAPSEPMIWLKGNLILHIEQRR